MPWGKTNQWMKEIYKAAEKIWEEGNKLNLLVEHLSSMSW